MSIDADVIQALLERTVEHFGLDGRHGRYGYNTDRLEHPVGLTWAWGLDTDHDPHGQRQAMDIANSRALENILSSNDDWDDDWDVSAGGYIFRLLDDTGQPTAVANEIGPILHELGESFFSIDEDVNHEVESEFVDQYWETEVLSEIRNERKIVNWHSNWELDFYGVDEDEDLPDDWEEVLAEAYHEAASRGSGGNYDDHGYETTDLDAVAAAIDLLGWLAPFTISDDDAQVAVDQALAEGGVVFEGDEEDREWGLRTMYGRWFAVGEPPHPIAKVMRERRLDYTGPRFAHR